MEFRLNEKEESMAEEFLQRHRHSDISKGAIGGHIEYIFTPTAVADAVSIHCCICGKEENITDYDSW